MRADRSLASIAAYRSSGRCVRLSVLRKMITSLSKLNPCSPIGLPQFQNGMFLQNRNAGSNFYVAGNTSHGKSGCILGRFWLPDFDVSLRQQHRLLHIIRQSLIWHTPRRLQVSSRRHSVRTSLYCMSLQGRSRARRFPLPGLSFRAKAEDGEA